MYGTREHGAEKSIVHWIESYLKSEPLSYLYRLNLSNKIMTDHVREEGDQNICYKIVKQNKVNLIF